MTKNKTFDILGTKIMKFFTGTTKTGKGKVI